MNFGNINPMGKLAVAAASIAAARTVTRQARKTQASGSNYRGGVKDGLPHGHGVYESSSMRYEGAFDAGKRHGQGVLRGPHGEQCSATFKRNVLHGDVKVSVPKGQIENATPGDGAREFKLFYHGMADHGRTFGGDHMLTVHEPKDDPLTRGFDGPAVIHFPNGLRCEGTFSDGRLDGNATITWPAKKLRYENKFLHGFNEGPGIITHL